MSTALTKTNEPWTLERIKARTRYVRSARGWCALWTGATNSAGYGHFTWRSKTMLVHRFAWMAANGPVPVDRPFILHTCDNRLCWRHTYAGTRADNMADMVARKRQGSRSGLAKFSKLDVAGVQQLRSQHHAGEAIVALAAAYNISTSMVQKIVARKRWSHV